MTFKTIREKFRMWQRVRENIRELSRLTDRELADLGIGRGDIAYVARSSAESD